MRGFSKAIIAGNLTRDPELRTTHNGASVWGFRSQSIVFTKILAAGNEKMFLTLIAPHGASSAK